MLYYTVVILLIQKKSFQSSNLKGHAHVSINSIVDTNELT